MFVDCGLVQMIATKQSYINKAGYKLGVLLSMLASHWSHCLNILSIW